MEIETDSLSAKITIQKNQKIYAIEKKQPNPSQRSVALCSYNVAFVWQFGSIFRVPIQGVVPSSKAIVAGTKIYLLGLKSGSKYKDKAVYNMSTRSIHRLESSDCNIIYPCVCVRLPHIYVIGGSKNLKDPIKAISDCFCLNTSNYQWNRLPPLNHSRTNAGGVYHNNHLYIVGGNLNTHHKFLSLERFDFNLDKWINIDVNFTSISHISCVAYSNSLVMFGANTEVIVLDLNDYQVKFFRKLTCDTDSLIVSATPMNLCGSAYIFNLLYSIRIEFFDELLLKVVLLYLRKSKPRIIFN